MQRTKLTLFLFVSVFFITSFASASDSVNYTALKSLAKKYGMRYERDPVTSREIFSGNGGRMVVCSGMSTILVNNKLLILKGRAKSLKGRISVPRSDLPKIEKILKGADDSHKKYRNSIKKIVIDPGHGGTFRGCKGKNGLREKDVVLDISLKLRKILKREGYKVVMTRTKDVHFSPDLNEDLERRVEICNYEQPDLFISVHANWCRYPSVRGFEIYYCNDKPLSNHKIKSDRIGNNRPLSRKTSRILAHLLREEYKKESRDFAEEIQKALCILGISDRGIRKADFRVVKKTTCPSILVETDYLSNKTSAKNFSKASYRQRIAEKLARGIINFQKKMLASERFTK